MTFRSLGLVPATLLLAVGVAHAQSTGGGGQMAYPDSLPSGQVKVAAPTARDTGSAAYPASPGGVSEAAPTGRDTGNMAYPGGRTNLGSGGMAPPMGMRGPVPMRNDVAPMAPDSGAARRLSDAPATAPIPYTDFLAPAAPMGKAMAMHKPMMHHAAKKATMATPAAATPAK